jgi:hypothetical protein
MAKVGVGKREGEEGLSSGVVDIAKVSRGRRQRRAEVAEDEGVQFRGEGKERGHGVLRTSVGG